MRAMAAPLAVSLFFSCTDTKASEHAAVVRVKPGQTLNAAIASVRGPVRVMLPAGGTEHDESITRNDTVIIQGQGERVTTLRPSPELGPDDGVALRHVAGV